MCLFVRPFAPTAVYKCIEKGSWKMKRKTLNFRWKSLGNSDGTEMHVFKKVKCFPAVKEMTSFAKGLMFMIKALNSKK